MLILVPWKPVALVVVVLAALVFAGYVSSSLMQGKNPFEMPAVQSQVTSLKPATAHANSAHKNLHDVASPVGR